MKIGQMSRGKENFRQNYGKIIRYMQDVEQESLHELANQLNNMAGLSTGHWGLAGPVAEALCTLMVSLADRSGHGPELREDLEDLIPELQGLAEKNTKKREADMNRLKHRLGFSQ